MDTMLEALQKAGITSETFSNNEGMIFGQFPVKEKYQDILPSRFANLNANYKYKKPVRNSLMREWMGKQKSRILTMLSREKNNRVYIFPANLCKKYFNLWIGYNEKYQRFVLRCDSYTLIEDLPNDKYIQSLIKQKKLEGIEYLASLIARCNQEELEELATTIFNNNGCAIPVEWFDPVAKVNSVVMEKTFNIDNINVNKEIFYDLDLSPELLEQNKLHINLIELFCVSNNIVLQDSDTIGIFVNLVHCTNGKPFKDPERIDYYMIA